MLGKEGFCLFSLPDSKAIHLVVNDQKGEGNADAQDFIFSPFKPEESSIIFTQPSIHRDLKQIPPLTFAPEPAVLNPIEWEYDDYITFIEKAQLGFDDQNFTKVIAARNRFVEKSPDLDLVALFESLVSNLGYSYSYLFYSPETGVWIGATPEVLMQKSGHKLRTMSLAGTKKDSMQWTSKEIEEQEIVTDFISSELYKLGAKKVEIKEKRELHSSHIQHLCNDIIADVGNIDSSAIALSLHPTPAISGFEKPKALQFIEENEGISRASYAGFLGLMGKSEAELYVNLRCLRVGNTHLELFAGAGITKDSVAHKEYQETDEKLQTLLQFL